MAAPARIAAFEALRAVNEGQQDLPAALARARHRLPDERDRALAAEIVTGTLRRRASLDFVLQAFASRPLDRLDPEVLDILRLSAYQVLHLDRVPASAAVDDGVSLARFARRGSAGGFINAVLRSLSRQRRHLPSPERPGEGAPLEQWAEHLAVVGSHPAWLVHRWVVQHGVEATDAWCRFNNEPAPLTLRANTLRISREELQQRLQQDSDIQTTPTTFAPDGLIVTRGNPIAGAPGGRADFLVQDEASQVVTALVAAHPGQVVLDLCAAPGGKTTALAAAMDNTGLLVASDVRARRMRLLHDTVRGTGACAALVQVDGRHNLPFGAVFDRVLVDAPCSGLGTLRRDPDVKWRRQEEDLAVFAEAQRRLIARAAAVVKREGLLLYSTCSSEPEENEAIVDGFLAEQPDFEPCDARLLLPTGSAIAPLIDDAGHLRTWPYRDRLEGFFAAALRRRR